ncbi:TIGR04283 family arsenosugar biosynthesis glycosyltransferase [Candidatus Albibeggiatoa sp. nov. NOAA]|uniref:TIGR04283 family arsenosugar biosynthesis glycosyltransferase n=1 Tax=Candidatus Albibeggiatoa sp. nov. NOAA TaxID=3162724 RepID=UPI0032F29F46|nr:TIGR04283 family arsenosugar biosynthesis glycosyltransferase [Thiotrichaceae bacterium]
MQGLLSIIIPTFNAQTSIIDTLTPLQMLREQGHEVIVVDGGSEDDTCQLAAPLADNVVTSLRGRAQQMNLGAQVAKGKVLVFLTVDTFLPEYADWMILVCLYSDRKDWGRFDIRLEGKKPSLRMVESLANLRSRLTGIATGEQAIFVKRNVFEQMQGFPEIPVLEDISLSRQLRRKSRPVCLKNKVIVSERRWAEKGLMRTIMRMWRLRFAYALGVSPWTLEKRFNNFS